MYYYCNVYSESNHKTTLEQDIKGECVVAGDMVREEVAAGRERGRGTEDVVDIEVLVLLTQLTDHQCNSTTADVLYQKVLVPMSPDKGYFPVVFDDLAD